MLFQDIVFWILAVTAIGAALGVVLLQDLFRAALLLVVVFVAVAGFFVMMNAEFLAVVQVLIYVGAIAILILFAIMLTKDVQHGNLPNRLQIPAVMISTLLLATLTVVATTTDWNLISENLPVNSQLQIALIQTQATNTLDEETLIESGFASRDSQTAAKHSGLADLLILDFVLPFEAVSVLLLAAAIGALSLVREK
jgi:NADH:ubiquinone oxidoreductase subunit 6 (subunit J)